MVPLSSSCVILLSTHHPSSKPHLPERHVIQGRPLRFPALQHAERGAPGAVAPRGRQQKCGAQQTHAEPRGAHLPPESGDFICDLW